MLGTIEESPAAMILRYLFQSLEHAPKVVEVDGDFITEQKRLEEDVRANRKDLLDEGDEWTPEASAYCERLLMSWVSSEYLEGAEFADAVKAMFILDGTDWWPLEEVFGEENTVTL